MSGGRPKPKDVVRSPVEAYNAKSVEGGDGVRGREAYRGGHPVALQRLPRREDVHRHPRGVTISTPSPSSGAPAPSRAAASASPSLSRVILGCPFQDSSPHVMPECREGPLPSFSVGRSDVACLLYKDEPATRASQPTSSGGTTGE